MKLGLLDLILSRSERFLLETTQTYLDADEDAKRAAVDILSKRPPVSRAAREAVENLGAMRKRILEQYEAELKERK